MKTKRTRHKLLGGLGGAVVATLMVFTGLAPAGADIDPAECLPRGLTIAWREGPCGEKTPALSLNASRYSRSTGEVMWEREPGAVGYEILLDGVSLGIHDVLSWYVTGLEEYRGYYFDVRAIDGDGNYTGVYGGVLLDVHN